MNIDLHHLRVFRTVASAGGFTRASGHLHISQSTVSQHIKFLEDELGCELFLRAGRRILLTNAGRTLLEYSERILQDISDAEMAIREMNAVQRGTLRFGTGATTLAYRLPGVLTEYQRRYPGMELLVETGTTESLRASVRSHRLDLAIIMLPVDGRDLDMLPLGPEELVIVLDSRHPCARKQSLRPEMLSEFRFILYEKRTAMQNLIDAWFEAVGVRPRITMEMENIESIKSVVHAGLGASILPLCAVRGGTLRALRLKGHPLYRQLGLISLKSKRPPKAIREFARMTRMHLCGEALK